MSISHPHIYKNYNYIKGIAVASALILMSCGNVTPSNKTDALKIVASEDATPSITKGRATHNISPVSYTHLTLPTKA